MSLIAIDPNRKVYFSFGFKNNVHSLVETFMAKLGYSNTDYYFDTDNDATIVKLIDLGFTETEITVWSTYINEELVYIYMII